MKIQSALAILAVLSLSNCGGGSSGSEPAVVTPTPVTPAPTTPTTPTTPVIVDDISCNVSYPLAIKSITTEQDEQGLAQLIDGDKTAQSTWLPANIDTSIVAELEDGALVKELVITWKDLSYSHAFKVYASKDKEQWQLLDSPSSSMESAIIPGVVQLYSDDTAASTALYLKLELAGNSVSQASEILEIEAFGCIENVSHNIELIDWYLSVPTDEDNNSKSDSIKEGELHNGYFDPRFFSLSSDGGLVFTTSVTGYKTSTNTKYVRSELREMLRRGNSSHSTQGVNKNNWVFASAPQTDINNAGGIDGLLSAELAVNHVSSTGEDYQIGRVIIGQIHANDDEPARLYYRKLPNNVNGSIYLAHELLDGDDTYYELIGSRDNDASNPEHGIPLGEKFSYSIDVQGNQLTVTIVKSDGTTYSQVIDMSSSGYDTGGQYMYFKAGVYNQNNSGDTHDYVRATFYKIENSHTGYLD